MTQLEDIVHATMAAPEERRKAALRVLRGEAWIAEIEPATPRPPEPLLTLQELSEKLGLSPCTLWRWQIPGHDMGGRRRFRLSEVAAYFEGDEFKRRKAALRAERRFPEPGARKGFGADNKRQNPRKDRKWQY